MQMSVCSLQDSFWILEGRKVDTQDVQTGVFGENKTN